MNRVTNRMLYNSTLVNTMQQQEGMLKYQEQIASGKRVNRPSDDPTAVGEILTFKNRIAQNDRFMQMSEQARMMLNTTDNLVSQARDSVVRAKELAIKESSGSAGADTRSLTASEIDQLVQHLITVGNSKVGNDYLFGGASTDQPPLDANGNYRGNYPALRSQLDRSTSVPNTVLASDFLTTDLNPALNSATPLTVLNGGQGVTAGSFTITDRAGGTGTVTVTAGQTVGNVVSAINASGANVTAAISADGYGISITDNTAVGSVTGALTVAENGSTTAQDLGVLGSRNVQTFTGNGLNPSATAATRLADLFGGAGHTPTSVLVMNGATSATVSFTGATTVGDVLTALNNSGANITASLNTTGTAIDITSATSATVAYAMDTGAGNTAELLGFGGGRNTISTLNKLSQAMKANDSTGIRGLLNLLDEGEINTSAVQGGVGAVANRVQGISDKLNNEKYENTLLLSNAQDADLAQAASELALLQTAYQATIKSSSAIIQPTLLDYIR